MQINCEIKNYRKKQYRYHWYYKPIYNIGMKGNNYKLTRKLSDWLIHRIPYNFRFELA